MTNNFTGNENHSIPLPEAAQMTLNYRNSSPANATLGHYFGKTAIIGLLNQAGAVGMRLYYGLDDNDKKQLIAVAVDANGNDLYEGLILDRTIHCPPFCGNANPLNSTM